MLFPTTTTLQQHNTHAILPSHLLSQRNHLFRYQHSPPLSLHRPQKPPPPSFEGNRRKRHPSMAMIHDRPYPRPLHNFNLTRLRWGSQKHMMCLKDSDRSSSSSSSSSVHSRQALPSLNRTRFAVTEEDRDEIDAVRERLTSDLGTETNKIKEELLKGGDEECEMEEERATWKLARAAVIAGRREEYEAAGAMPWNLRTRRAASKAPAAKNGSPVRKEGVAEEENALLEKKKESDKFAVALERMEIEEDFWKLTKHRPPRRPKKRQRAVQKQLDMLFPGLWLTEITSQAYEVV